MAADAAAKEMTTHQTAPDAPPVNRLSLTEEDLKSDVGFLHQFSVQDTYPLHTHSFYEIFLINRGKGIHKINGESVLLSEGSLVLIRPDDRHSYAFLNQYDMELINIAFPVSLFDKTCSFLGFPKSCLTVPALSPMVMLTGNALTDVQDKLLQLGDIPAGQKRRQLCLAVLPYLLYQFIRDSDFSAVTPLPAWLSSLIRQMEQPDNFVAGLPRMIELSHMSQEHLGRSFQRFLHMSPTEFINLRRMEYAATLLLDGKLQIIDICHECGFTNVSYFYRIFHRQYGCSPKHFPIDNRPL